MLRIGSKQVSGMPRHNFLQCKQYGDCQHFKQYRDVSNTKVKSTVSTVSNTKLKSTVSTVSSTKMNSTVTALRRIEYYFEDATRV